MCVVKKCSQSWIGGLPLEIGSVRECLGMTGMSYYVYTGALGNRIGLGSDS